MVTDDGRGTSDADASDGPAPKGPTEADRGSPGTPAGRLERLQKVIAHAGLASRRAAEEMIRAGRVTVDGARAHLGQKVDPSTARIEVDGIPLPVRPGLVYHLVYKPVGVISTASDERGRQTVVDLVGQGPRVYPVGRLDRDSEGLMLLTNDGELAQLVTHPRYGVSKTYTVLVDGVPSRSDLRRLVDGVELEDGIARARSVRIVDRRPDAALLEIVMGEGRKREIRRMLDALGHPVRRLVRTAIGPIRDRTLRPGEHRPLSLEEVRALYAAAGRPVSADDDRDPEPR